MARSKRNINCNGREMKGKGKGRERGSFSIWGSGKRREGEVGGMGQTGKGEGEEK